MLNRAERPPNIKDVRPLRRVCHNSLICAPDLAILLPNRVDFYPIVPVVLNSFLIFLGEDLLKLNNFTHCFV